ncbi:MAG: C25 family cysteine peptidase, partial [Planctomycetota bacterium]
MYAGHGKSLRSSAGSARSGEPQAQRWLGLELLEPRLLLSGSGWEQVLAGVSATAALDSTSRFSWSGYQGGSAQVELSYAFSGRPEMTDGQAGPAVTLDGESDWVSPGDPMVPVRTSRVLLPPGTHIVSAEVSFGPGTVVAAGVGLAAAPTPVPYGNDAPAGPHAPAASFPAGEPVRWSTESLAGYRLGRLELFPVRYTAADGTITSYEQITVTLTLAADEPHDGVAVRNLAADASRVLDLVDNDSAISGYVPAAGGGDGGKDAPLQGSGPYEYVLITSSALSGEFQRLVDHKTARGLSATLVTTEHVYANYTSPFSGEDDNAGKIREFLTQAYTQWNTRWVLLAGDVDQVAHRMVRVSANDETATFASDMYFACLDGPYNANPDGHWAKTDDGSGGGDVDRMPELFVGRATVSTPAEAGLFVDKTIRYESQAHPNVSDSLWLSEKLDDDPVTWGAEVMEIIRDESFPDDYDHVMLYERDGAYTTGDVVAALNASPNFVNHLGHADWTNSAKLYASDVRGLVNQEPYFLYSEGCESGRFERDDAIAEEHIQVAAGAWAVIMNTHFGWYQPGSVGGSYYWHSEFWDAVFNEGITRVGEAHFDSKTDLGSTSGTDRWVFFACQLFGDP